MEIVDNRVAIGWSDLTFKVKSLFRSDERIILNKLIGILRFGTITALMGPSGCGLTSLLKCINGMNRSGLTQETKLYLSSVTKIIPCFVTHNDRESLIMSLTAKENLLYSSKLQNSNETEPIDHENSVKNLMNELMITETMNTKVENCSGGEQKRLTIALQMTASKKPNLLCIDEPITGLDSNAAEVVIQCLKNLTQKHSIATFTSIHQTNSETLMRFHFIYVLANGGNCVFFDEPMNITTHLNDCGIVCNEYQIPIEVLVKICSKDTNDRQVLMLSNKTNEELRIPFEESINGMNLSVDGIQKKVKNFKIKDFWYLLNRLITETYINKWKEILMIFTVLVTMSLFMSLVVDDHISDPDGCYNKIQNNSLNPMNCLALIINERLISANIGFIIVLTFFYPVMYINAVITRFIPQFCIFLNEHQNGWYSSGVFVLTQFIIDAVPNVICVSTYGTIVYLITGQSTHFYRILMFNLVLIFYALCHQNISYLTGILFHKNISIAVILLQSYLMFSLVFCNGGVVIQELTQFFQYFSDLFFYKLTLNSIIISIYGCDRCSSEQYSWVLYRYKIHTNDYSYNLLYLSIHFISTSILIFILIIIKTNRFQNLLKRKTEQISDQKIKKNISELTLIREIEVCNECLEMDETECEETESIKTVVPQDSDDENFNQRNKTLSIAWTDLVLKVEKTLFKKEMTIINGINGFVEFGSLVALMGPSGAGKTSLLNCINGKYDHMISEESKFYLTNKRKIRMCFISHKHKEHLMNGLTAKQSIIYASKLKNVNHSEVDHKSIANNIINEMMINCCADTNVENCSASEQKRIVIAMELSSVRKPNLICIDEPTSGLDSNSSEIVIECLKQIAIKHEISVISSIHQPNNDILMLFDMIYILSKGGVAIYSDRPQNMRQYLTQFGINCNQNQTPNEVLLKIASKGIRDQTVIDMSKNINDEQKESLDRILNETKPTDKSIPIPFRGLNPKRFWYLLMRSFVFNLRHNWRSHLSQSVICLAFGWILTLVYDFDLEKANSCMDFNSSISCFRDKSEMEALKLVDYNIKYNIIIFFSLSFLLTLFSTIDFSIGMKLFFNEHRNGWYSPETYYISKCISDLVPTSVTIICFCFIVDVYDRNVMLWCYLYFTLFYALCLQTMGRIVAIIISNTRIAAITALMIALFFIALSGSFIPTKHLNEFFKHISNISPLKTFYESILIVSYGFDRCKDHQFSALLYSLEINDYELYKNGRLVVMDLIILHCFGLIAILLKYNSYPFVNNLIKLKNSVTKQIISIFQ